MQNKQILVVLSGLFYSLGVGYALGLPSVLIPVLLSTGFNGDGETEDMRQISFLYTCKILASGLGFLIIAIIMQIFGRKIAHIILNISLIISLGLCVIAKHISIIFLAQAIQGISVTGIFVEAIILSEYCHKKRRGVFMSLEKSAEWFGGFMCHLLGSRMSWKYVYLVGLVPPCVAIALTILWPESPYFHAMNGQYVECEKSFHLLHGKSDKQRRELHILVTEQKKKLEHEKLQCRSMIANTFRKFLENSFWKVFLIMAIVISVHSVRNTAEWFFLLHSHNISTLFGIKDSVMFLYLFMLLASLLSCFIILIERRTVLLVFGFLSALLLSLASIIALRVPNDSFEPDVPVLSSVILFYNFFINLSILPVCAILFGELYFLEHKGIGMFASGIVFVVLQVIYVTMAIPLAAAGFSYTHLNTAWFTVFGLTILFFILPETKDKTLQEIEDELRGEKKRALTETSADNVEMGHLVQSEDKRREYEVDF